MSDRKTEIPSPTPVLVMFALAVLAIVQLLFPTLIHPGLTLTAIGIVFLALYFVGWIREALTLILGWMLAGFGLAFWAANQPQWATFALPLILIGLGAAFVAIYFTAGPDGILQAQARYWPVVPGALLLVVAGTLILEGIVTRERLWSVVVPMIPAISAVWYLMEWRKAVEQAQRGSSQT